MNKLNQVHQELSFLNRLYGVREINLGSLIQRKSSITKRGGVYFNPALDELAISVSGICLWRVDGKTFINPWLPNWITDWSWDNWEWIGYE